MKKRLLFGHTALVTTLSLLVLLVVAGCSSTGKLSGSESEMGHDLSINKRAPLIAPDESSRADKRYQGLSQAIRSGKPAAISEESAKILANDPDDLVTLNALGLYHYRGGRLEAAKLFFARALAKHASSPALHSNMGAVLMAEEDYAGALVEFKKAIRLDDGHGPTLANLGSLYVSLGDYSKAQPILEQAYRRGIKDPGVAVNYAITLRADKNYEGARKVYEEVLKNHSRDVSALINYASLLIDYMNKPKEGLALVYKVKYLEIDRKDVLVRANALENKAKSEIK